MTSPSELAGRDLIPSSRDRLADAIRSSIVSRRRYLEAIAVELAHLGRIEVRGVRRQIVILDVGEVAERELIYSSGCEPRLGGGKHGLEARVIAERIEVYVGLSVIQQAKGYSVEDRPKHFKCGIDVSQQYRQMTAEVVAHF